MKVLQTIARRYPNGKTFTWKFGQLPDGRYAAKGLETGRKVIFKSKGDYNQRFRYMTWTLGYTPLVEQLALPLWVDKHGDLPCYYSLFLPIYLDIRVYLGYDKGMGKEL